MPRGGELDYQLVKQTHFPLEPEEALSKTALRIREIAEDDLLTRNGEDWVTLALYRAMLRDIEGAARVIDKAVANDNSLRLLAEASLRLIRFEASVADLEYLLDRMDAAFQVPLLLSLWIRQLQKQARIPTCSELGIFERFKPFPPSFNGHSFFRDAVTLAHLYINAGVVEPAVEILEILREQYGFLTRVKNLAERLSDCCVCHS